MSAEEVVIAVDLGGTTLRAVAVNESGKQMGKRVEMRSCAQEGPDKTIHELAKAISEALDSTPHEPTAIGIAVPGRVDDETGEVLWAPNLGIEIDGVFRYWENVQLRMPLEARFALPIRIGNDANLAALGEYRNGVGRDSARCLVMLTMGTGIGGGVVLSPYSVQGKAQTALVLLGGNRGGAELGHILVQHGGLDCNTGSYGALEAYCQRDAIVARAVHRLQRGRPSCVLELAGNDLAGVTPKVLFDAAERGDELALEVWDDVGEYLGAGIGSLINVFAPDVVAIGGQVALAEKYFLPSARKAARNVAIATLYADTTIVRAEKLEDAGLLGAAALAFGGLD